MTAVARFARFAATSRLNTLGVGLVLLVFAAAALGRFLTPYPPDAISLFVNATICCTQMPSPLVQLRAIASCASLTTSIPRKRGTG